MANSVYGDTVNKILELSGQGQIAQADFADRSKLTRFQVQCKAFTDLANRMLLVKMNERFMQREFSMPLTSGIQEYELSTLISAENPLWHSFFLTTSGNAVPLYNWDYREFRSVYPDLSIVPSSIPRYWILIPTQESSIPNSTHTIRFYPNPDRNLTVRYQAKLNAQPLVNYTDGILWPVEYEHALWLQGRLFLEQALGEGKESNIEAYAQTALDQIKSVASAPAEQRQAIRPGLFVQGMRRYGNRKVETYPISQ
jgi:hypothetical protein